MKELYEYLGAAYGWVFYNELHWEKVFDASAEICKVWFEPRIIRIYVWCILYWPALGRCGNPPQVSKVRAHGIWSGFMSEARGLSWDRKSRYGKK